MCILWEENLFQVHFLPEQMELPPVLSQRDRLCGHAQATAKFFNMAVKHRFFPSHMINLI